MSMKRTAPVAILAGLTALAGSFSSQPPAAAQAAVRDGAPQTAVGAPLGEATVPTRSGKLVLGPCTTAGLPPDARCGTFEVPENRAEPGGRTIPLRVAVIPATGPQRLNDPLVYFAGGPGDSSVGGGSFIAEELAALRGRRDILLVDFRGTGESGGLFCEELQGSKSVQAYLDDFLPAAQVKSCAERLGKQADLTQYTSDASMDDIDDVRAALGYDKLNIFGTSAGSRAALVYLRRHPERVRTLILWGVVPPDERGPFSMARSAQDALDGWLGECEQDAACRAAFPKLREEVAAVLQRAERDPVTVRLVNHETGQPQEIRLSKSGVAQTLRYMLYGPATAVQLPLNVHLAAQGDWKPLAESARFFGTNLVSMADGYYLALTCAEDLPFLSEKEIPGAVQNTFLGDFRIRKQQAACAAWPAARLGREVLAPVTSDVPALLISGERDPVTPPGNGVRAARTLRNSRHLVMPDGAHSFEGIQGVECVENLMIALVESGSVQGIDPAVCTAAARRPEFVLAREPEVQLSAEQLARLTGTYLHRESGRDVRIEVLGSVLRGSFGDESLVLVPTSPSRFRVEGLPPGYALVFQPAEGRPATLTLEQPGGPAMVHERQP
jgi:pimeloyl-ACP methyl ester carboxylesterase